MRKIPHRQFRTWNRWFEDSWNEPTLSDFYAMQTAAEVRRVLSKKPNDIKLEHFKMSFSKPKPVSKKVAAKAKAARSLASWKAILGIKSEPVEGEM